MMKEEADGREWGVPGAMNLETILILTGEMDHLADLLRHRAKDMEGAGAGEMVRDVVHPLLDELEAELRARTTGITGKDEIRGIIAAWIDRKVAEPCGP